MKLRLHTERVIMFKKIMVLLAFLPLFSPAADLLWQLDLSSPEVQKIVAQCPYAKIAKDFEKTDVLTFTVPKGREGRKNYIEIPIDLEKTGMLGNKVYAQADVSMTDIPKTGIYHDRIECSIHFHYENATHDPSILYRPAPIYGTHEWFLTHNTIIVYAGAKHGCLALGLQAISGTVSFRNIKIYAAGTAPVSPIDMKPVPQAVYTKDFPVMRGVMSPMIHTGYVLREEDFADLQKWGVNIVRWQLCGWGKDFDQYKKNMAKLVKTLPQALDMAHKYNIKLLVDLHTGEKERKILLATPEGRAYFKEIWIELVKQCKGNPGLWGYDIMNEPHSRVLNPGDPSYYETAGEIIKAIRAIDPETPIVVEPDGMGGEELLRFLPIFPYPNIFYSIHMYTPGDYTHQLDRDKAHYLSYPTEKWNKTYLKERLLDRVVRYQKATNAKIFVGEFSCPRWAPGAETYLRDVTELMEEFGWSWTYHAFRESDMWSVEHNTDPHDKKAYPDMMNPRKQVLLDAFQKNRQ